MNLFLNSSSLHNHYLDCCAFDVSETIERDCLSVLHKLHDQVNGLQLVQVVVQPLARLFNPASLAALVSSNPASSPSSANTSNLTNVASPISTGLHHSNAATPNLQNPPCSGSHHAHDLDGISTTSGTSLTTLGSSSHKGHSRAHSFASAFNTSSNSNSNNNSGGGANNPSTTHHGNSLISGTSTYMMSPDTAQALIARLDTDRDVNWLMEIIGYGLSMPFSITGEQDSVKDCCTIYCEWLGSALLPYNEHNEDSKYQQLSKLVPVPIRKDPNRYARKMLSHLYNVFLPRQPIVVGSNQKDQADAILTAVSRQAVLCHRVLRTIENIAQNPANLMDSQTWDHLLALLLTVNDKLLSPPTEPDDIGTQLHDRILGVLFELVTLASAKSVPTPGLWKTFHEMCLNWRHRPALVDHWRRITLLLTKRLVQMPSLAVKNISRKDSDISSQSLDSSTSMSSGAIESAIAAMSYENLSQTWYRFLNLIGNPVELSDPNIISRTDEFYHSACASDNVLDPRQHPCLNVLPQIFMNSMSALRDFVDTFLFKMSAERPNCNSLLHIFGNWLFSAALIGSDLNQEIIDSTDDNTSESTTSIGSSSTATEISGMRSYSSSMSQKRPSKGSITAPPSGKQQASLTGNQGAEKITLDPPLSADSFESGQAQAMAILSKIFSSKTASEDISPTYLSRFYLCLQHCLTFGGGQDRECGTIKRQLLASVLTNSTILLQKDLDGMNLLIPSFIKAIELVFECSESEVPVQPPPRQHNRPGSIRYANMNVLHNITNSDLRRACILTLLNLLAYPFHFNDLVIRNCLNDSSPTTTFGSLRPRLLKLLFVALQTEGDPTCMQILFGGLSLTIHDLASNSNHGGTQSREESMRLRKKTSSSSSANTGNDSTSSSLAVDNTSQSSFVYNSTGGFIVKSLHVTCHLLINIWKHDTQVSLAALELLTTIARLSITSSFVENSKSAPKLPNYNNNNMFEMRNEYKQTTKWICDYICNQCSRPPPAHSRDMHSTIVAAYQCLSVWFYNHPYLLNDEDCINTLMEVIELGVSGQKSKSTNVNSTTGRTTQSVVIKSDKIMKPSSMRVREAAESLLNICMVRTSNSNNCNDMLKSMSSYDTTLDEHSIAELFGGVRCKTNMNQVQDAESRQNETYKLFKYFSDDDSLIVALLEGLNHDPATKDSVICLMRTPFGRHCWKMKFNYYTEKTKEKIIANKTLGLIKRPFQQCTTPTSEARMFSFPGAHNKSLYFNNAAKFFPETIEKLPPNDLDNLVTSLDNYSSTKLVKDSRLKNDLDKISKIFTHQVLAEQKVLSECSLRIKRTDCEEPQPLSDLEATRIIVTHLQLKSSLSSLKNGDSISESFINDLKALDSQSVRTCDWVNIFYVRKNRTSPKEILESVRERHNVCLGFFEWLLELGQPSVVKNHNRWTGKVPSSPSNTTKYGHVGDSILDANQATLTRKQMIASDHGGAIFDGDRMLLYWSDMCQELAFLVPHKMDKVSSPANTLLNINIFWLESHDDISEVPCEALLSFSETGSLREDVQTNQPLDGVSNSSNKPAKCKDSVKYFISPMKNGLYRLNVATSFGRQWLALPLVDGMTVSKGMLSSLIRESVLNLCRRRRLDADQYQPPHVKRRLKIQDICNNHKISSRHESTEFYYNIFKSRAS